MIQRYSHQYRSSDTSHIRGARVSRADSQLSLQVSISYPARIQESRNTPTTAARTGPVRIRIKETIVPGLLGRTKTQDWRLVIRGRRCEARRDKGLILICSLWVSGPAITGLSTCWSAPPAARIHQPHSQSAGGEQVVAAVTECRLQQ